MRETHEGAASEPFKEKASSKYKKWPSLEELEEKYSAYCEPRSAPGDQSLSKTLAAGQASLKLREWWAYKEWREAKSIVLCWRVKRSRYERGIDYFRRTESDFYFQPQYELRSSEYLEPFLVDRMWDKSSPLSTADPASYGTASGERMFWAPPETSKCNTGIQYPRCDAPLAPVFGFEASLDGYETTRQPEPEEPEETEAEDAEDVWAGRTAARAVLAAGMSLSDAKAAYKAAAAAGHSVTPADPIKEVAETVARRFWYGGKWPAYVELSDLVQLASDAIQKASEKYDESRGAKQETFYFQCAKNALLNYAERTKTRRDVVHFPDRLDEVGEGDVDTVETDTDAEKVAGWIDALPDRQAEAVYGRFILGESQKETAQRMRISERAVQKLQEKGIEALRREHAPRKAA